MNALYAIDRYLWKNRIPSINPEWFRSRLFSSLAIFYISLYPQARKFMRHYLGGNGSDIHISTKQLLSSNPAVIDMIKSQIDTEGRGSDKEGILEIGQDKVNHPNYKYSVGSFILNYSISGDNVRLRASSIYRWERNTSRITHHLHNRMSDLKDSGSAKNFNVVGDEWNISLKEFSSLELKDRFRDYMNFNILYV